MAEAILAIVDSDETAINKVIEDAASLSFIDTGYTRDGVANTVFGLCIDNGSNKALCNKLCNGVSTGIGLTCDFTKTINDIFDIGLTGDLFRAYIADNARLDALLQENVPVATKSVLVTGVINCLIVKPELSKADIDMLRKYTLVKKQLNETVVA